ncbi:hypothetical protein ACET53_18770, partial [Aeromonas veronii]
MTSRQFLRIHAIGIEAVAAIGTDGQGAVAVGQHGVTTGVHGRGRPAGAAQDTGHLEGVAVDIAVVGQHAVGRIDRQDR